MKVIHEVVSYKLSNEKELIQLVNTDYANAFIAVTVQYKKLLERFTSKHKGVVLGCNVKVTSAFTGEKILFIGDGVFHALMLKKQHRSKKVYTLNPLNMKLSEIKESDVRKFITREAVGLDALKHAKKVGIIISTKFGQSQMSEAISLKSKLENEGKLVYLFLFDNVNPTEFLNFPGLDCLINTACLRLALDDYTKFPVPVVNYSIIQ